jgi:hypothetical protein
MQRLRPVIPQHPLIKVGPLGDGGYLMPDDWQGIVACFSPGVSTESGFEQQCAARGLDVFLADASVAAPAVNHPRFSFRPKYIGAYTAGEFISMDDWVGESPHSNAGDLLLQMDIEGYEYEALLAMSMRVQRRFRIIVVEFHNLHCLFSLPYFAIASRVFDKLLATHSCVHIHPNNVRAPITVRGLTIPPLMEFTFHRNDRITTRRYATRFPHPLDAPNIAGPSYPLPPCWYSNSSADSTGGTG